MQLYDFQKRAGALWRRSRLDGPKCYATAAAAKLAEESGEVAKELLMLAGETLEPDPLNYIDRLDQLEAEVGDVLFVLARICDHHSISLAVAADMALERFSKRVGG